VNRAGRRRAGERGKPDDVVVSVDEAIELNSRFPLPGLAVMLLGIRRDYGPGAVIGLNAESGCVQVYL
jgi:hypothetical protein